MRLFVALCGICGVFSPKGREGIGREPKDGSNLEQVRTLKKRNKRNNSTRTRTECNVETVTRLQLDILKNKSSFGVKIC
jgi:hypothetical protein